MGDSAPIMISTSYTMPAKRFISQGEMSVFLSWRFFGSRRGPKRNGPAAHPRRIDALRASRKVGRSRSPGGRLGSDEVAQKRGQFPEIVESHKLVRGGAPVGPSRAISERADRACDARRLR